MANTGTRQAKRTPVTLKIKFKSATLDQFIERYSVDVSHGGIFIRTKDPLSVGTTLKFEFQLRDASPLIRGEGTVVWTREHDPSRAGVAPGMGVRFDKLPPESQQILDKILTQKAAKGGRKQQEPDNQFDSPTRVAPSPLVQGLKSASSDSSGPSKVMGMAPPVGGFGGEGERTDATPLPTPMPFHSDMDDFPDEAFEEKTRVAALDQELVRRTIREDLSGSGDGEEKDEEVLADAASGRQEAASGKSDKVSVKPAASPVDELAERRAARAKDDPDGEAAEEAASQSKDAKSGKQSAASTDDAPAQKAAIVAKKAPATTSDKADAKKADAKKADAKSDIAKKAAANKKDAANKKNTANKDGKDKTGKVAVAAPAADAPPEQRSSGSILLLAAIVVLLGGGGAYYMFAMNKGDDAASGPSAANRSPQKPTPAVTPKQDDPPVVAKTDPPDPTGTDGEPKTDTPPAIAPENLVDYVVTTTPAGATASLVGSDQSGPTPMKFVGLDKTVKHEVEITHDGFVSQKVEFDPSKKPVKIALVEMQRVLTVTSTPAGASVYINGRKQKGVTPMEIPLTGALAKAATLNLSLRKPGYLNTKSVVARTAFAAQGDVIAHAESVSLTERPAVAVKKEPEPPKLTRQDPPKKDPPKDPPKKDPPKKDPPKKDPGTTDTGTATAKTDPPPKDPPKKDPPKKDPPKKDPPADGEGDDGPTPDWMK